MIKLVIFLTFVFVFNASAESYSQISIRAKGQPLAKVMADVQAQSGLPFILKGKEQAETKIDVDLANASLREAMDAIVHGKPFDWLVQDNTIVIRQRKDLAEAPLRKNDFQSTASGSVKDFNGVALAGVTVAVVGTTRVTSTDEQGRYTIQAAVGETLRFTLVGFEAQTKPLANLADMAVTMQEVVGELDEVVVVGYGVQKKVNLTGAISTINVEKEMESRPVTNLSAVLSGMAAGVQTFQGSGKPNSDVSQIRIRGVGTLNNASPLVLVDGMEQSLNDVNPNDVATISILKDAASSAIYGNRGANGVILVTTKQGVVGTNTVNYRGLFSINRPANLISLVSNSADYFELINESALNIGQGRVFSQHTIDTWREAQRNPETLAESGYPNRVAYPNTDWYEEIFSNNRLMSEHTVSVGGASQKVNYNFSGTFFENPGLVENTGLNKYYVRANITADLNDWLKIGNRTYGYHTDQKRNEIDAFTGGIHGQKLPPDIFPVFDGRFGFPEAPEEDPTSSNPFHLLNSAGGSFEHNKVNTAMFAEAKLFKDLVVYSIFDYSRYGHEAKWLSKRVGRYSFRQAAMVEQPVTMENMANAFYVQSARSWRHATTANWNKAFDRHEVGVLGGYEAIRNWGYDTDVSKRNASNEILTDLSTYTDMANITGNSWESASQSYFGRLTYAFDSRYLLEVNTRYDGSSRFSPAHRWGLFPSFSAGWRISQERFMERLPFDELKLRASWGRLGNNSIGDHEWQATYNLSNYVFGNRLTSGLAQTVLANRQLRWEAVTQTNVGLEFAVLRGRLSGEIDLYDKLTDGILYRPNIYATAGNKTSPRQNFAEVTNRGVELAANWKDRVGQVSYGVSGNFAYNRNWVSGFKGELERGWVRDADGNQRYVSNLGDVSDGGNTRILEGRIISEYYLKQPYSGDGTYHLSNGLVNPVGGPRDGMIRTEQDMEWLLAMQGQGFVFYPNQAIGQANLWYGDYIYADLNGDGIYGNDHDREFQAISAVPKTHVGLQLFGSWNGFDLSTNWAGAFGFGIYWYSVGQNSTSTIIGYGISESIQRDHYFYDPLNPEDPRTNLTSSNSRLTLNQTNQSNESSTLHLQRGDFLKLRSATLGYTLPEAWGRRIHASKVRCFASGENLWTITKFSGMDPEMRTGMGYVTMRQFAFGINVNF